MKKFLLLLSAMLIFNVPGFASSDFCDGYSCVSPYDMNSKLRTFTGAVTGVNALTELKVEGLLKKGIHKMAKVDNLKVDVESYSSKDMKNGIFKSIKISGDNIIIDDVHMVHLDLKTLCDFNYIQQVDDKVVVKEDMPILFNATITQDTINRSLEHARYHKMIDNFNKIAAAHAYGVQIKSTKITIRNGKLYYIVEVKIPFIHNEQKLVFETNVGVKNGRIVFSKTHLVTSYFNIDMKAIDLILKYLNPIEYSVDLFENKKLDVNVKNISIDGQVIKVDGIATLPKDE